VSASQGMELTWHHRRAPEPKWYKFRLSRQSLRDLAYWRSLTCGGGRDLHLLQADLTMHSNAADEGYGGMLGTSPEALYPGLWEAEMLKIEY
jgi:hypothetical protein